MSCFERDIIEEHKHFAKNICDFLYVDGKGKKGFKNHTEKEYQIFLEELAKNSFDSYNEAAKKMGWID